jgi:hypothetical protein
MFLIRLLLRLALLFFLLISLALAWRETNLLTRLTMILISLLLIAGIYALRYLRSAEDSSDARFDLPASAWQMMWSRQTPFFPPATTQGASYEVSPLASGFNRMSPGFHIVCARLLPMAASALATWQMSAAMTRHGGWLSTWLRQTTGLNQADLSMLSVVSGVACYMLFYAFVQAQFIARVPARCMSPGCTGRAFLATEVDASKNWGRPRYQFVYLCRELRHRHATGVQCMGF